MGGVYEGETVEFRWGKKRGLGGKKKDVRFYESFNYDNVEYALYDCVYLYKEGEPEPFIGKLIKIWENSDKSRRVKVLWFFRPCEILNYLGAEVPLDNELFLASGEGVGLANINPLEAIAGKCNVVCISKDVRNPPPSEEQVQLADFVFYRTFDVGLCEISDKIKENIAGIEVRFILNRQNLWKSEGVAIVSDKKEVSGNAIPRPGGVEIDSKENKVSGNAIPRTDCVEIDSDKNKFSGNAVPGAETVVLSKDTSSDEHRNLKTQGSLTKDASEECRPLETEDPLTKEKCTRGEKRGSSVYVESSEIDETINLQPRISSENTSSKSKTKENEDLKVSLGTQKSFLKKVASVGVQSEDVIKTNDGLGNTSGERTNTGLNINENVEHKASSIKQKSSVGENPSSNVGVKVAEKDYDIPEKINHEARSSFKTQRKVCKAIVDEVDDDDKVKSTTNSDILESRPSKRPKVDNPMKVFEENDKNHVQKLGYSPNVKASTKISLTSEEKSKPKLSKTEDRLSNKPKVEEKLPLQSHGRLPKAASPRQPLGEENPMDPQGVAVPQITKIDNRSFKKPKLDEKRDGKLPKASSKQHLDEENTDDHQAVEVNQRPNADRRKWFSELSWEERMKAAYKQGTLVLLENLAPAYTSAEVENIVWHGFKTSCTAKMIQRTAYSSRFSGQALVIFKTKEAAYTVVTKLDEGCFLLSNERPLIGRFVSPPLPGKQSTFFGHLAIEKLRGQMQREMKEAVSTSHCSQPNTLEYDMAKEWCLLQERWDCTWKKLHQQQGKELEELNSKLKIRL